MQIRINKHELYDGMTLVVKEEKRNQDPDDCCVYMCYRHNDDKGVCIVGVKASFILNTIIAYLVLKDFDIDLSYMTYGNYLEDIDRHYVRFSIQGNFIRDCEKVKGNFNKIFNLIFYNCYSFSDAEQNLFKDFDLIDCNALILKSYVKSIFEQLDKYRLLHDDELYIDGLYIKLKKKIDNENTETKTKNIKKKTTNHFLMIC